MTDYEYHKSIADNYCELIQKGEEDWKKQPTSIKVMFNEMLKDIKEHEYFPYNNKYFWVGMILGINGNCNCKEE